MSRTALALILATAIVPFAAACGTTSEAAPAPKAQPASSTGDAQSACVEVMTRNRSCTDDFIPALVDARARIDAPPGIAADVKADRTAVIAKAKEEWAEDSKDEAIARHCQAMIEHASPADLDAAHTCLAKQACGEYVTCIIPAFEKALHK